MQCSTRKAVSDDTEMGNLNAWFGLVYMFSCLGLGGVSTLCMYMQCFLSLCLPKLDSRDKKEVKKKKGGNKNNKNKGGAQVRGT